MHLFIYFPKVFRIHNNFSVIFEYFYSCSGNVFEYELIKSVFVTHYLDATPRGAVGRGSGRYREKFGSKKVFAESGIEPGTLRASERRRAITTGPPRPDGQFRDTFLFGRVTCARTCTVQEASAEPRVRVSPTYATRKAARPFVKFER